MSRGKGVYVYHIAEKKDWKAAVQVGLYVISTRGKKFAEVGYIHMSYKEQVLSVAESVYNYKDRHKELVLLTIKAAELGSDLKIELSGKEYYPHLYKELDTDLVKKEQSLMDFLQK